MEVVDGWTDGMRWDGLDEKRLAAGRGQARTAGSSLSPKLASTLLRLRAGGRAQMSDGE